MAFDYAAPYETIRLAVAAAVGLPDRVLPISGKTDKRVDWVDGNGSNNFVDKFWVDLRKFSEVNIGRDETRWAVDDPTVDYPYESLKPAMCGHRRLCIQANIRSQTEKMFAPFLAGKLRTRLRLPRVHDLLRAGNVTFEAANMSYDNSYRDADNRKISESVVDLWFLMAVVDKDEDSPDVGWVEEVNADGDITYAGGVVAPVVPPPANVLSDANGSALTNASGELLVQG